MRNDNKLRIRDIKYILRCIFKCRSKFSCKDLLLIMLITYGFIGLNCLFVEKKIIGRHMFNIRRMLLFDKLHHYWVIILSGMAVFAVGFYAIRRMKVSDEAVIKNYNEFMEAKEKLRLLSEELGNTNEKLVQNKEKYILADSVATDIVWDINLITKDTFFPINGMNFWGIAGVNWG